MMELKLEIQEWQNFDMRTILKKVRQWLHACRMFAKPPSIPPHADPSRRSTPPCDCVAHSHWQPAFRASAPLPPMCHRSTQ